MANLQNSVAGYVLFATQTVDTFVAGNGRLPSMDFVMTHLRHTAALFGYKHADHHVYSAVVSDLHARFPAL